MAGPLLDSHAHSDGFAAFDGRPLAYATCVSIVCAFAAFISFVIHEKKLHPGRSTSSQGIPERSRIPDSSGCSTENSRTAKNSTECNGSQSLPEYSVKDLDSVWLTFTDVSIENRFMLMTSEFTFTRLKLPMACLCVYMISELMMDSNWDFAPSVLRWNHDAAVVMNVSALAIFVSCYYTHTYFNHVSTVQQRSKVYYESSEKVLVCSISWIVSLVLFFGTRHRVSSLFSVNELKVFGSVGQGIANDEVSTSHTLLFTLMLFSLYVPIRFYYLLHLSVILGVLYPFSLYLRPSAGSIRGYLCMSSTMHIFTFYIIVALMLYGHRCIEMQRRGAFKGMLQTIDARMEMDEQIKGHIKLRTVGTALERLLTNLRSVDKNLQSRGAGLSWATPSRACIKESLDILSHTDGLFALNVDTMFKNDEKIASLDDSVDFKRYLKIQFGQAGGRKMFDGVMSEKKADALLSTWNKRAHPRKSMRRDTRTSGSIRRDTRTSGSYSPCTPEKEGKQATSIKNNIRTLSQCLKCSVDMRGVGSDWNFDTLSLSARTGHRALIFVGEECVVPLSEEVFSCVESKELMRLFIRRLWSYYLSDNPYHNEAHGATVCHMAQCLVNYSGLKETSNPPELMGLLVAALGHDCGHFGRNNLFCENMGHRVALMYNDVAVLENMHAAITIRLLAAGNVDYMSLLDSLSLEQRRAFKSTVISFIIATDMKKHFEMISKFRSKVAASDWCLKQPACRNSLGKLIIKASDVGQAAVKWDLHMEWSMRVLAEFFEQGDEEVVRQLPVSPLCNRASYDLTSSQKFFTDVLCRPLFEEIRNIAGNRAALDSLLKEMSTNTDEWKTWVERFPWDPALHHWPPTMWWPDWKKHTPTGRAINGDCNPNAIPYVFNEPLTQVTSVDAHLDLITGSVDPEDFEPAYGRRSTCQYERDSQWAVSSDMQRLTTSDIDGPDSPRVH